MNTQPRFTLRRRLQRPTLPLAAGGRVDLSGMVPLYEGMSGASITDAFRYVLWRRWGPGKLLVFMMLNPSTADASLNDATIRKCMGFAAMLGYDGIIVVNQHPFRATDPADLIRRYQGGFKEQLSVRMLNANAVGSALRYVAFHESHFVCAWGANAAKIGPLPWPMRQIHEIAPGRIRALKVLADGTPGHPLYLRGDSPLITLEPEEMA